MTQYAFTTKRNLHFFCEHCGVRAFGVSHDTPIGTMYGINIGCLEDINEEQLSRHSITYVDGLNERSEAPAFLSHL